MDLLNRNIIKMIDEAKRKETKNPAQPTLPLIHLRVSYRNEDYAINKNRFGQRYIQQVNYLFFIEFCIETDDDLFD